ncbi:Erythronate-4-phosphate dehydrogenase family protein [Rhynchospora pubera]|uniref:Erythronate-4-phosphate dehydrogenase family protein n=1 Tax=Rhynchospora pubera TaxID=906938 RepID=A0AAV8EA69_9POAL|nr:Erythronate-4-phosphate dehydrogenase family protein [Rhynchospora pubera]
MEIPDSPPNSIPAVCSLEIRLFYVRLSPCGGAASTSAPEHLSLDLSGHRVVPLKRDRLDRAVGEATYVSTDPVRLTTSAVDFEVSDDRGNLLLCGTLERFDGPWINGKTGWSMACYSAMSGSMGKMDVEVSMAGSFAGTPVILTQTVQLSPRNKAVRPGGLDSIPEVEEALVQSQENGDLDHRRLPESVSAEEGDEFDQHNNVGPTYYPEGWYQDEDGQLSWFNAGVRVGVGIGLGMCVGIGIGVGLLMRSYQATTRTFRRRFF